MKNTNLFRRAVLASALACLAGSAYAQVSSTAPAAPALQQLQQLQQQQALTQQQLSGTLNQQSPNQQNFRPNGSFAPDGTSIPNSNAPITNGAMGSGSSTPAKVPFAPLNNSFTNTAPTFSNGNIRTANPNPVAAGSDLTIPKGSLGTPASFRNQNLIVGNGTNPTSNSNGSTTTNFGSTSASFSNTSTLPAVPTAPLTPVAPFNDQQLQNSRTSFQDPAR